MFEFDQIIDTVLSVAGFVVALGVVIGVHELGHFLAAKKFGVYARKFALGFGRPLVKWGKGETEYSIRPLPLGGYVDLAGEDPSEEVPEGITEDRMLYAKPVWQRAVIFSAGVAMNAVLAVILFILAPMLGIRTNPPEVGYVMDATPAARAGIEPGAEILAINGKKVDSFEDIMLSVVLSGAGEEFELRLDGPGDAGTRTVTLRSTTIQGAPGLGMRPVQTTRLDTVAERSLAHQAGLRAGDRILSVAGTDVEAMHQVRRILEDHAAGPVTMTVEREGEDGKPTTKTITADPATMTDPTGGMKPAVLVGALLEEGSLAETRAKAGDVVARIGDVEWPTVEKLRETVAEAGAGTAIELELLRDGARIEVAVVPEMTQGRPVIGVLMAQATEDTLRVGHVEEGGAAEAAGIRPGDIIAWYGADKAPADDWSEMLTYMDEHAQDEPVSVGLRRGGEEVAVDFRLVAPEKFTVEYAHAIGEAKLIELPRISNPLRAISRGFKQAGLWIVRAYRSFASMLTGEVSVKKSVGGPVMIFVLSQEYSTRGIGAFLEFWGMIAVFVTVINFLPIPPFDGGHVLFLGIEKIKGSPVSIKVRGIIWTVAWVGILVLFVLVMYNDIARLFGF